MFAKPIRHKFKAIRCEEDDIKFPSKKERRRYQELKLLKQGGEVLFFIMQTPFHLPGKIVYRSDFMVFWENGNVTIEDVKGFETPEFKMKRKLLEESYPIKLTIIR